MAIYINGFALGLGLIVAIGAQNVFVLTQSIKKKHHWLVAFICSLSDMILIFIGTTGIGTLIAATSATQQAARWGGAFFLFFIGVKAFLNITRSHRLEVSENVETRLRQIIALTLAFTFLNPHVYLDTVLLLGGIGGQYESGFERILFASGAAAASFLWFFGLAWCGSVLAPLFKKTVAWKILDFCVGTTMWTIGWQLVNMHL